MANFTLFRRRSTGWGRAPGRERTEALRRGLPRRFEAVREALASDTDPSAACSVAGSLLAQEGASLGEALEALRATYALVRRTEPDFAAVDALAVAWSEATLEYLHRMSCEDPLTGLASLAHVRTRLTEVYRAAAQAGASVREGHALVVVDVPPPAEPSGGHELTRVLRQVQVTEAVRRVFSGGETVGGLGRWRVVALTPRRAGLAVSVGLLRAMLADLELGGGVRVWIEGLPDSAESAAVLLDELARPS